MMLNNPSRCGKARITLVGGWRDFRWARAKMKQAVRDERVPFAIEGVSRPKRWVPGWSVETPEERDEFRASMTAFLEGPREEVDWGETYAERDARAKAEAEELARRKKEEAEAEKERRWQAHLEKLRLEREDREQRAADGLNRVQRFSNELNYKLRWKNSSASTEVKLLDQAEKELGQIASCYEYETGPEFKYLHHVFEDMRNQLRKLGRLAAAKVEAEKERLAEEKRKKEQLAAATEQPDYDKYPAYNSAAYYQELREKDLARRKILLIRRLQESGVGLPPWTLSEEIFVIRCCRDFGFKWTGKDFTDCMNFRHQIE